MGRDNVEIFEKIIFSLPNTSQTVLLILFSSLIYGALFYVSIIAFTSVQISFKVIIFLSIFLYALPALLAGEIFYQVLPEYPRNWGYFLTFVNSTLLFIYSLILSGADNISNAWSIFWLGILTVFISSFLVLLMSNGKKKIRRISIVSPIQFLIILASFHFFIGRKINITFSMYIGNFFILLIAAFLILTILFMVEYLLASNVSDISALNLISSLLNKKQASLNLGRPSRPRVHTVSIQNKENQLDIGIPWIHPGPLAGFGGGKVAEEIITELNNDSDGFFLHVPTTHSSDLANPESSQEILKAIKKPERKDKASKLLSRDFGDLKLYGRRIEDKNIIYLDFSRYDDFEVSIIREAIDPDHTVVIDLHNHLEDNIGGVMANGTTDAKYLKEKLSEFEEDLKEEVLHDYRAGYSLDIEENPSMVLIEELDEQKTVLLGIEGNGVTKEMKDLKDDLDEKYDQVLLFSTDTHASLHDLANGVKLSKTKLESLVEEAEANISEASIGLGVERTKEIYTLQEDYSGLIFSINILIRFLFLALALMYLGLILWVFF